jgi:Predicted metal-dependent hydrolase of the TIM-barrel fold
MVPFAATAVSRRELLAGGAAALAIGTAAGFAPTVFAQAAPHRIDVHHHVSPPTWLDAVKSMKKDNPPMVSWSVQKSLDDMDKGGVATAITSPTTPQVIGLDKDTAARVARESNEYCKKLESDHKDRFGTFAMLPFPYVDECLKEIAYAFDTLKVDGIGCMTSYGDKWLGYAEFEPVWEELNRRKATVYTHPTTANCCVNLVRGIDDAYIEFGTDTTRSIFSLIFSGSSQKNKILIGYGRTAEARSPPLRTGSSSKRSADPLMQARLLAPPWTVNSSASITTPLRSLTTLRWRLWRNSCRYRRLCTVPIFRIGPRPMTRRA